MLRWATLTAYPTLGKGGSEHVRNLKRKPHSETHPVLCVRVVSNGLPATRAQSENKPL